MDSRVGKLLVIWMISSFLFIESKGYRVWKKCWSLTTANAFVTGKAICVVARPRQTLPLHHYPWNVFVTHM